MTADLAVPANLDLLSSGGGVGGVLLLLPPGYVTAAVFYLCAPLTDDSFLFIFH